jgi:hypothetical protein
MKVTINYARNIVDSILCKYSSGSDDETHCRTSELRRDFTRVIEDLIREKDDAIEMHEAWMRIQRMIAEDNRPFLQRLFRRAS